MSITKLLSVHCDVCRHWEEHVDWTTAQAARTELRQEGWRQRPGGVDLCPKCSDGPAQNDCSGAEVDQ